MPTMDPIDPEDPRARALLGRHALVGITYLDDAGGVREQVQLHGEVVEVGPTTITLRRADTGEKYTLPPELDAFQPARPGIYRLRATGEEVENPDLLATWTVHPPRPRGGE